MKRRLAVDLAGLAPDLVRLVRELVAALHARGPGGARITPEEWAALGEAIGVVAAGAIGELQKNRPV
jgi:hypothetical protein